MERSIDRIILVFWFDFTCSRQWFLLQEFRYERSVKKFSLLPIQFVLNRNSTHTHTCTLSIFSTNSLNGEATKKKCFNVFAGSFSKRFILSDCILSFHSRFNLTIRKLKPEKIIIAMKIVIVVIILLLSSMLLVSLSHTIPTMMNYFIGFFFGSDVSLMGSFFRWTNLSSSDQNSHIGNSVTQKKKSSPKV